MGGCGRRGAGGGAGRGQLAHVSSHAALGLVLLIFGIGICSRLITEGVLRGVRARRLRGGHGVGLLGAWGLRAWPAMRGLALAGPSSLPSGVAAAWGCRSSAIGLFQACWGWSQLGTRGHQSGNLLLKAPLFRPRARPTSTFIPWFSCARVPVSCGFGVSRLRRHRRPTHISHLNCSAPRDDARLQPRPGPRLGAPATCRRRLSGCARGGRGRRGWRAGGAVARAMAGPCSTLPRRARRGLGVPSYWICDRRPVRAKRADM